jgi:hypothetical protein
MHYTAIAVFTFSSAIFFTKLSCSIETFCEHRKMIYLSLGMLLLRAISTAKHRY